MYVGLSDVNVIEYKNVDEPGLFFPYSGNSRSEPILIGFAEGNRFGADLGGASAFHSSRVPPDVRGSGVFIGGLRLEVDLASSFDALTIGSQGCIVFASDGAYLATSQTVSGFSDTFYFPLNETSNPAPQYVAAGFRKWRFVKGEGDDAQVVYAVDTPEV